MIRMHLNEAGVEFLYSLLQRNNTREDVRSLLRDGIEREANKQTVVERFAKDWHINVKIPAAYSNNKRERVVRLDGSHFFWGMS